MSQTKRRTTKEKQEIVRRYWELKCKFPRLSIDDGAKCLGIPESSLRRWVKKGVSSRETPVFSSLLEKCLLKNIHNPTCTLENLRQYANRIKGILPEIEKVVLKDHTFSNCWGSRFKSEWRRKHHTATQAAVSSTAPMYENLVTNEPLPFLNMDAVDQDAFQYCVNNGWKFLLLGVDQLNDKDVQKRTPVIVPDVQQEQQYANGSSLQEKREQSQERMHQRGMNNLKTADRGSSYSGECIEQHQDILIIDTNVYRMGVLNITLSDKYGVKTSSKTKVSFNGNIPEVSELTDACRKLGVHVHKHKKMYKKWFVRENKKKKVGFGYMIKMYFRARPGQPKEKTEAEFDDYLKSPMNSQKIEKGGATVLHGEINVAAKTFAEKRMKRVYQSIKNALNDVLIHPKLGGKKGLCMHLFMSTDLQNESHYDVKDQSLSFVHWSSTDPSKRKSGWYFVMPNIVATWGGRDYSGVAIKLTDGITIEWDGKALRHASTRQKNHKEVQTFGTWFGVSAI